MTAITGSEDSILPPNELLALGTALLSAVSTDPEMASHPQLLTTIPLLLQILADGPVRQETPEREGQNQAGETEPCSDIKVSLTEVSNPECKLGNDAKHTTETENSKPKGDDTSAADGHQEASISSKLDEALAADCYHVLASVCSLPRGPEQLLNRGAVPALCQAVQQNQTFSQGRGLSLLQCLLSGRAKDEAWRKHSAELLNLLVKLSKDFCQSTDETRLDMCSQLVYFLPPFGVAVEQEALKEVVGRLWEVLRPTVQAKLTPTQIRPVLVLSACLLDLYGWEQVGPPKFCCLLVNRACVEVRMGLEEPPGNDLSPELQDTLTGTLLDCNHNVCLFLALCLVLKLLYSP